jgi:hypothetical protein
MHKHFFPSLTPDRFGPQQTGSLSRGAAMDLSLFSTCKKWISLSL